MALKDTRRIPTPKAIRVFARTRSGRRNMRIDHRASSTGMATEAIPKVPATTVCTTERTPQVTENHSVVATRTASASRNRP
jgi:hypothetical protein